MVCYRYEIGEALYIGWASGVLAICGGACLMFSCKLGTKEKTWVSLSQSLKLTHTLLFHILSHFSFSPFLLFYACVHVFGACFLHSASSLAVTTSPHVKQFTQHPHPGETLRALMEEMPMSDSEWSNSGQIHGQTTLYYITLIVDC